MPGLCPPGLASAMGRRLPLGGGVDPEVAELAVERRAADPEAPCDFRHSAPVVTDRKPDDVGLDLFERPKMALAGIQCDARCARDGFLAARMAQAGREIRLAAREARLNGDVREILGGEGPAFAMQACAEQYAGQLANVARPAVAHQQSERVVADRQRSHPG